VIVAAGLTPAWQQVLQFDHLRTGQVNRARSAFWCASGKVLNVGAALRHLRMDALTISPAGGMTGRQVIDDFEQRGIPAEWIAVATPTRVCTTLLETSTRTTTELVENSAALTAAELGQFRTVYESAARKARCVVLTGSLPQGTPSSFYRELMAMSPAPAVLDVRGRELLECLPLHPLVVKPNREELAATVGRELPDEEAIVAAMAEVRERGAEWVLVSDGAAPLRVLGPQGLTRIVPDPVTVVNPIGCGDSLTAAVAARIVAGRPVLEAVQFAAGYASRKAAILYPVLQDPADGVPVDSP